MRQKQPNKHSRFAYAVIVEPECVQYRLSRRLFNMHLQFSIVRIPNGMDRKDVANRLRRARKELLDRCDAIELELLEKRA